MSTKSRLILDATLFAAFLLAYCPATTGISVHEWLSLALVIPALFHVIVNWDWVTRVVAAIAEKLRTRSALDLVVDGLLFVATVTVMLSGLMVSQVVSSVMGVTLVPTYTWHAAHSVSADAVVVLLLVHLALHWRRVIGAVGRLAASGVPAQVGPERSAR
jgi:hypothetical protein